MKWFLIHVFYALRLLSSCEFDPFSHGDVVAPCDCVPFQEDKPWDLPPLIWESQGDVLLLAKSSQPLYRNFRYVHRSQQLRSRFDVQRSQSLSLETEGRQWQTPLDACSYATKPVKEILP